jgi:hypothetical protein
MSPVRIQRRRAKGWRMPPGAVYVGRPTIWGNPFRQSDGVGLVIDPQLAVDLYRARLEDFGQAQLDRLLAPLEGYDLCCWCRLNQPCHADVLLEWANG